MTIAIFSRLNSEIFEVNICMALTFDHETLSSCKCKNANQKRLKYFLSDGNTNVNTFCLYLTVAHSKGKKYDLL